MIVIPFLVSERLLQIPVRATRQTQTLVGSARCVDRTPQRGALPPNHRSLLTDHLGTRAYGLGAGVGRGEPVGVGGGVRRGGGVGRGAGVTLGEAVGGGVK